MEVTDETETVLGLGEPSLVWAQFSTPDPPPDSQTGVSTRFGGSDTEIKGEVRSLHGHEFNPERITVTYRGRVLKTRDIPQPSRRKRYSLRVPPKGEVFEVTMTASDAIETGSDWESVSTVPVKVTS